MFVLSGLSAIFNVSIHDIIGIICDVMVKLVPCAPGSFVDWSVPDCIISVALATTDLFAGTVALTLVALVFAAAFRTLYRTFLQPLSLQCRCSLWLISELAKSQRVPGLRNELKCLCGSLDKLIAVWHSASRHSSLTEVKKLVISFVVLSVEALFKDVSRILCCSHSLLVLDELGAIFLARALGVISTRLLDGVLIVVFGSDVAALVDARTHQQLEAAGLVDLRVVTAVTLGSSGRGADLEWRTVARR